MNPPRHSALGVGLGLWAALVLLTVPTVCLGAEPGATPAPAWELACGLRYSSAASLGYDPGIGAWCWRDQRGERWTLHTELLATTAEKGIEGSRYAAVILVEERRQIRDGRWWWGVGSEWTWDDGSSEWTDRLTLGLGFVDVSEHGRGQALTLRLLGEDGTAYRAHGFLGRWETRYPQGWRAGIEVAEIAYTVPDSGAREWGRRYTVLLGYGWRGDR